MNPLLGWTLAAIATLAAWRLYGLPGIAMAAGLIVFWLLLQFNRALRVMRNAGGVPVGHLDNAVMFNARLRRGLTMLQVVTLAKSLGRKVVGTSSGESDVWDWTDAAGDSVVLTFVGARLERWQLVRAADAEPPAP